MGANILHATDKKDRAMATKPDFVDGGGEVSWRVDKGRVDKGGAVGGAYDT